jgi:hypothetical protein
MVYYLQIPLIYLSQLKTHKVHKDSIRYYQILTNYAIVTKYVNFFACEWIRVVIEV